MKFIYIILGFISLGLGVLGIILPILPTTPFLLLSAFLFSKSSSRLHDWFLSTSLYQKYIHEVVISRKITPKKRTRILCSVTSIFLISIILTPVMIGKLCLMVVLLVHHYFMFTKVRVENEGE